MTCQKPRKASPKPAPPDLTRPLLTAAEVFSLLGIDRSTGYKTIHDGTFPLPIIKIGRIIRIPTAAVIKLLDLEAGNDRTEDAA